MPTPAAPKPQWKPTFSPSVPHTIGAAMTAICTAMMKIWNAVALRLSPGAYSAPTCAAMLPLKQPTPTSRQAMAMKKLASKAIMKWPSAMREAPSTTVRVRPRSRSATRPPRIGVR